MRQIAEFIAVLSCSLFTGAAVYLSLVEHPARMEWGVEIAATGVRAQLPPSHCRAGELSSRGAAILHCGVASWGERPVGRWRGVAGLGYPVHADCDLADQ